MLIGIGVLLLLFWVILKFVYHIASMGIHVFIVAAIVLWIVQFMRGHRFGGRGGA